MNLGERIYELRKAKNLSQENLAESLNVTRQTISKWETNQSTPDFEKIIPLCKILDVGIEEFVTGEKKTEIPTEEKVLTKQEVREMSAKVVSTSIFIYVAALVFMMIAISILTINPILVVGIFLLMIAWATVRIIRHYMSIPKFEKTKEERNEDKVLKQINSIIRSVCIILYFIISFITFKWHITWIIIIIYILLCQVTKLIFMLKGGKENGKNEE